VRKTANADEFDIIKRIKQTLDNYSLPKAELSIGDDCACYMRQISCLDILQEDIHFSLQYYSFYDIGYKALAANLSDIAAMGGKPLYALVGLSLPEYVSIKDVQEIFDGMAYLAAEQKCAIVGGDISKSPKLALAVTVIGKTYGKNMLLRSGAKEGDILVVSGTLGLSHLGLKTLSQNLSTDVSLQKKLMQAHLRPQPRLALGQMLLQNGIKCAIDCSDGFLADVGHILDESKLGVILDTEALPLDSQALDFFGRKSTLNAALSGGEDYELIFSASPKHFNRIKALANIPVTLVGTFTKENVGQIQDLNGRIFERKGYKHFG